jgi:hypothetical protein
MSVEKSLESKEEKVEVAKEEKNDNSNTNNSPMHDDEKNGMLDTFAASPVSHRRSITGKYDDFNYTQNEILLSRNGKIAELDANSSSLFPQAMNFTGSMVQPIESLFDKQVDFFDHLDNVLGKEEQIKQSSRPRKQLIGQWPFDDE